MNATATGSSISLCKLFANKVCVNQDGVPWTNPLVATPNNLYANVTIKVSMDLENN